MKGDYVILDTTIGLARCLCGHFVSRGPGAFELRITAPRGAWGLGTGIHQNLQVRTYVRTYVRMASLFLCVNVQTASCLPPLKMLRAEHTMAGPRLAPPTAQRRPNIVPKSTYVRTTYDP